MAQIDTSIYGQIKQFESPNPLAQYAQIAQLQQAQNQNRLAELAFGEKRRAAEEGNALRSVLSDQTNYDAAANLKREALPRIGAVAPAQYATFQKQMTDQEKAAREAEKAKIEGVLQQFDVVGRIMGPVRDQASYDVARQQVAQLFPQVANSISPTYDPATIERERMKAMGIKDQLEQVWKQKGYDLEVDKFGYQKTNDEANRGVTIRGQNMSQATAIRGQNMVDARAKEANTAGKAPAGYRWSADGTKLEAIQGGPADKAAVATEGERKAATLLQRLEFSEKQLSKAVEEKPSAAKPGVVASGLRAVGAESLANTVAVGPERQRVEGAQLDLLDAALTLGTGAAYTREQLEGYRKSYFPQIGDTDDAVKDKQARLSNVIQAAKIAAGRAATGKQVDAPARNAAPKAGDVMDGYRFKGGNPADKSNWVKVN